MVTIGTLNGGNITVTLGSGGSTPKWHVQALASSDGWDEDWSGDGNPYINPVYQDYTLEGTYEDSSYEDENVKLRIYKEVNPSETLWKIYAWIKSFGEEEDFGGSMDISDIDDEHPTKTRPDEDWTVMGIEWR